MKRLQTWRSMLGVALLATGCAPTTPATAVVPSPAATETPVVTPTAPSPIPSLAPTETYPQIAFEVRDADGRTMSYVSAPDGSGRRILSKGQAATQETAPAVFSPDSLWAARADERGVTFMEQSVSGTSTEVLVGSRPTGMTWSTDSQYLAFVASAIADAEAINVFVANPHTGELRAMGMTGVLDNWAPTWSAQGDLLAYAGGWARDGCGPGSMVQVLSMPDGSQRVAMPGALVACTPDWSPTGSILGLAAQADVDASREIYLVDASSWQATNISQTPTDDCCVSFSPDGRYIAFLSHGDGTDKIFVAEPATARVWRLTDFPDTVHEYDFLWEP